MTIAPFPLAETGWLLAKSEDDQTRFLRFGSAAAGMVQWTLDEAKAVRFVREEDASNVAMFLGLVAPAQSPAEAFTELNAAVDKWAPWLTDEAVSDEDRAAKAKAAADT